MKINRVTVVIASTFLALSAATGVAAAAGGHNAHSSGGGKASPSQVGTFTPWYRPPLAKVTYRPHMICDEFNHDVTKDRRT